MRSVLRAAILASAMVVAAPAVAQVHAQGPSWHGQGSIPAPSGMHGMPSMPASTQPHWNGPRPAPSQPNWNEPRPAPGQPHWNGPRPSPNQPHWNGPRPTPNQPHWNGSHHGGRWGGNINGRWHGGMQAPGGWGGYHRPSRGYQLDGYWLSGDFLISDYYDYGLQAPPNGYYWSRYYDDAVLIDSYGRVRDSVSGIAWADADADEYDGYASSSADGYASASAAASTGGYSGGRIDTVEPNDGYYEDQSGYADEGYGARYPEPRGGYAPPVVAGPPAAYGQCLGGCSQPGYYYPGATTTTVVVQYPSTAVTTTTTTTEEVIEESSSYARRYVSRPGTKLVRRSYPTKRLRRTGCGC